MLSEGKSSLDLGVVVSAEAGVYLCSVLVMSHIHSNLSANNTVTVFVISEYVITITSCICVCLFMCLCMYVHTLVCVTVSVYCITFHMSMNTYA